jgi:hypothetical protein
MSKKRSALLLIGFGVFVILVALAYGYYQQRISQIGPAPLPGEIAGLTLRGRVFGAPALDELFWMHGQDFQLNQAAVGNYGAGNEITIYAAGTAFGFIAGRLIIDMRDKIASSETPFTPLVERQYGSRRVYELEGMGQKHYYFRSGNLVIWLAGNEQEAEWALGQALDFYP